MRLLLREGRRSEGARAFREAIKKLILYKTLCPQPQGFLTAPHRVASLALSLSSDFSSFHQLSSKRLAALKNLKQADHLQHTADIISTTALENISHLATSKHSL